jgi:hypothetical protein
LSSIPGSEIPKPSAPIPFCPAISHVDGCVAATHIGGCGFWIGFGITSRSGILKNLPSWLNVSFIHIFGIAATASSHIARESSGFTWKPPSSCSVIERPEPNSTRPFDMMSSTAIRSATRTGWLNGIGSRQMPWPSRIRDVTWLSAPYQTSGADEYDHSLRK